MPSAHYRLVRRRFIVTVTAVMVMMAGLFALDMTREYRLVVSGAEKRAASYAGALKEHAERVFSQADSMLTYLAGEIEANGGLPYARRESFHLRLRSQQDSGLQLSSIEVVDRNGDIVAHSRIPHLKPFNQAGRDFFIHHRDTLDSGLFISPPFRSRVSGTMRFSLSRPLNDGTGRFCGVISATFEISYFNAFYKTIDIGRTGRIILATADGNLLIMEPAAGEQPAALRHLAQYGPGSGQIASSRRLARFPAVATVSFDRQELLGAWRASLYAQGAIVVLLSFVFLGGAVLFLRQLRRLESASLALDEQKADLALKNGEITAAVKEWRGTFDALKDAVWVLDMDQQIICANKATLQVFDGSVAQVVGQHCSQVVDDSPAPVPDCSFERMLGTGSRATTQLFRNNRWYEISVDPIFDEHGEIIKAVVVAKDIHELKKAELREHVRSEILERIASGEPLDQLLSLIIAAIGKDHPELICSIMLVDDDGKRLVTGAAPGLPESYNRAVNNTRIGEGIGSCGTAAFRRERVVVEDIATHPFWKGFTPAREAGLAACWSEPVVSSTGQLLGTFAVYHRQPCVPGEEEIRLIEQAATFAAIALERSRNETERAELEARLGQSQKMEAIGQLAGGVAHDFNNLLTPIIVYADLIKRSLPSQDAILPKIDGIIKASHKARDLTQQLLSFGRKQVLQMQNVDLNEVVSSFSSIMRRTLRENIEIRMQLSNYPGIIRGDRSKIDQIILNLAINAQDAIAGNGLVTLETGQIIIDDEYARLHPGMQTGRYVLLAFKDNGCGMTDDIKRHIFEPFFTTKQVGQGTGLGLANVYGIVKQHKGYIAVQSRVGVGTTFSIYFPLVDEAPDIIARDGGAQVVDLAGGSETILLVEDNEMVREMVTELLGALGYRLYVADHPERALELLSQHPEKIDLLITDVVMPGMNGQQLFERISAERPDIDRVLYMSGYTNNVIVTAGVMEDCVHFLPKPFTVDALIEKVRNLLPPKGVLRDQEGPDAASSGCNPGGACDDSN